MTDEMKKAESAKSGQHPAVQRYKRELAEVGEKSSALFDELDQMLAEYIRKHPSQRPAKGKP